MSTPFQSITRAENWDAFAQAQDAHLLQTSAWGELKSQFGWRAERIASGDNRELTVGAQILYRPLAPGLTLAYVPRGPFGDSKAFAPFLEFLKNHVRLRGAFLLKIEPAWRRGDERDKPLQVAHLTNSTETIQPPATIHIDLTADLETLLARMKPKWRYNIRLAEKKGVQVRAGGLGDLDAFHQLLRVTGERDHFAIHSAAYYRAAFELLSARDNVRLFIAEYNRQPLAMIFASAFAQEAIYLYGASSNLERQRMPNHALHWAAMQWAKARGCTRYDLWGIPETILDSEENNLPSSLYQFKQGFGGESVRYTGAWDFVLNKPRHHLYKLARKYRKQSLG